MADDDCLTEELVVRHGGQYDPELLQRLTLSGLRLARLGAGLARCTALRVLDLARNKLQHLDGVEVSAPPPTVEPERPLRKVAYKPPPQTALPLDVLTLVARKDAHLATLIAAEGRRGGDGDHESVVTFT